MIHLKNISKTYPNGFQALTDINLEVHKGDIMGIIGYSGAGKSTLIRTINRLEEPSSGEIIIDGVDMRALNTKELQKQRQKIGMIFQHFNLLSARDVFGNITFALEIAGWKKSDIKPRVTQLLEIVGLSDKAHFYPSQLSGGQKQRVAIARALANYPNVLLCDEATSALDTKTTRSILALLKDIQSKLNLSIVLITHQMNVVQQICNKVCVISAGRIVEQSNVEDIFANARHEITKELISVMDDEQILKRFINKDNAHRIYRIIFKGEYAKEPLISQASRKFEIDVNILGGSIEELNGKDVGHIAVEFIGDCQNIQNAIAWLQNLGIQVDKMQQKGQE